MRVVNKIITIVMLLILIFTVNQVYAESLNIEVKPDKEKVKIEDEITVTVDWKEKMQAADYILKYDNTKLEYVKASVEDTYINKTKAGQIGISWFSSDNTDLTQMTFTFKAIEEGEVELELQVDGGFANGKLEQPEGYNVDANGKTTVKITKENKVLKYTLIACGILIILVIIIEIVHKKNKK